MRRRRTWLLVAVVLAALIWGAVEGIGARAQTAARSGQVAAAARMNEALRTQRERMMTTPSMRRAAALRLAAAQKATRATPTMNPRGTPDYFGTTPNFANSQFVQLDAKGNIMWGTGIRKFVDTLPGLGLANRNNLGQYLPVAVPDKIAFPGSDYYVIALR